MFPQKKIVSGADSVTSFIACMMINFSLSCLQCVIPLFRKTAVVEEHCTQEALAFQHYYCSLQLAIQNPEDLANILFAKRIIHGRVKEQIQVATHTHSQKCDLLLNAVERQLVADPAKFYVLADVLQEEHPTKCIAQQLLRSK